MSRVVRSKRSKTLSGPAAARLLTSGGQESDALVGTEMIGALREAAGERLVIMPGSGVRLNNIARLVAETGCMEYHTSARPLPAACAIAMNA